MKLERSSGILLHITSLPSKYGIGDFGNGAFHFIDFLKETKQKLWQILPLTITNSPSPYSSISTFAGNPWLISPDKLIENKLLSKDDLNFIDQSKLNNDYVNYSVIKQFKDKILKKAFENFQKNFLNFEEILNKFYENEKYWIDDFILFLIIKEKYEDVVWCDWPIELRNRDLLSLENIRQNEKNKFQYYLFVQYIFFQQWNQLKTYGNNLNIKIIGDLPMYIDYDSADVWANSNLFILDSNTLKPIVVSGFPGNDQYKIQIWNQPIYNWNNKNIENDLFSWWIKRLSKTLTIVDILRIDHFRAFISHYIIPIDINTQKPLISQAHWVKTPGYELFKAIKESLGIDIPLIVEDIGNVTIEVFQLRDYFQFYGIKILQMGFYTYPDNIYSPHNYIQNSIAYTGTHDNPTAIEWWSKIASRKAKEQFMEYIRRPFTFENELIDNLKLEKHIDKYISWYFIQIILQSSSNGAIVLMQDLLNVQIRMNNPGTESNMESCQPQNWSWRFQWSQLTSQIRNQLRKLTEMYGRDLKYGKSIPPEDMIMPDDTSFFSR